MLDGAAKRSRDCGRPCLCANKEERRSQVFYDKIHNKLDRNLRK